MRHKEAKTASELHIEIFGVAPVITGISAMGEKTTDDLIMEAIDKGVPYVEEPPVEGYLY